MPWQYSDFSSLSRRTLGQIHAVIKQCKQLDLETSSYEHIKDLVGSATDGYVKNVMSLDIGANLLFRARTCENGLSWNNKSELGITRYQPTSNLVGQIFLSSKYFT